MQIVKAYSKLRIKNANRLEIVQLYKRTRRILVESTELLLCIFFLFLFDLLCLTFFFWKITLLEVREIIELKNMNFGTINSLSLTFWCLIDVLPIKFIDTCNFWSSLCQKWKCSNFDEI